jgi:hypothetical protein
MSGTPEYGRTLAWSAFLCLFLAAPANAEPPVASYIFPAGGQRGKAVAVRMGGLFLHGGCAFEMLGGGVEATPHLRPTRTIWFEGPLLPLPESQQQEDYPKDLAGRVRIAADAPVGMRSWRLATDQGATSARPFVVGDLPEIVEDEIDGDPVPVEVTLPVTINGRIFPREDVDVWTFAARKGQTIHCEVNAARLGSPLDSVLEVLGPDGRRIAENDDTFGADSCIRFTAPADGRYQVRIRDANFHGGPAYVYRLTLTGDPWVDRAYPLGGRRGSKGRFELTGQGLPAGPVDINLPAGGPSDYFHRLDVGGRLSNPFLLDLDDLPEYLEAEPNDTTAQVQPVAVPAVLNGRIERPGDVDYWAFRATRGQALDLELRATRLGSRLDGVLMLCDAAGKDLIGAEVQGPGSDPLLHFTAPADGTYFVRVSDRFPSRGGADCAYRLRIAPPAGPDFRLRLAGDVLALDRGGQAPLKVLVERTGGFAAPVVPEVVGLPKGVSASSAPVVNQPAVDIALHARPSAAIGSARLTVRGSAKVGGRTITRTAVLPAPRGAPEVDSVLLAVALPTPFKIVGDFDMRWASRGTVHQRRYRIERHGFDGPIEVSLADRQARHLQGVTGPTVVVPAGVNAFHYPVRLPPWMETGRTSRTCVMGLARIKDADGREHVVSYSSVQNNEQVIVVVEPGRLGVALERDAWTATPSRTLAVPVQVSRGKGLAGSVRVELIVPPHVHGVTAEPVSVPAGRSDAVLSLRFAADHLGPFNMPLLVRATASDHGKPVVGEARLEILPAD